MNRRNTCACLLVALLAGACASGGPAAPAAKEEVPVLTGVLTREEVEAALPDWGVAAAAADLDYEALSALSQVEPGAEVKVYFGTWCSDSRREVSRLWRGLEETLVPPPVELTFIGVDRAKEDPAGLAAGADLLYVPTIVVLRDGREVGRIVEESPHSVEADLLALLRGDASGILTGSRPELLEEGAPPS